MLLCPKCRVALEEISYRNVTIDKCNNCEGVWLDKGEDVFATEILKHANQATCRDCNHYIPENKKCNLLKIFVNLSFSCSNYSKKDQW